MIQQREGIPANQQCLIVAGRGEEGNLDDKQIIWTMDHLHDKCVIHLVLQLRGGVRTKQTARRSTGLNAVNTGQLNIGDQVNVGGQIDQVNTVGQMVMAIKSVKPLTKSMLLATLAMKVSVMMMMMMTTTMMMMTLMMTMTMMMEMTRRR